MGSAIVDEAKIGHLLSRGVDEVIERDHLLSALKDGRQLRVKLGIDPTAPDLHLGHAVVLRKLKDFQDLGHQIVLVIGDFTARIGDPSGRSETRKPLTEKEIKINSKGYLAQAAKVLNVKKCEVVYNGKWFNKGGLEKMLEIAAAASMQQVLHRADFAKRLEEGHDVSLLEALYPLFQGYDSVEVRADVELGGTDQKFNLLMGRKIQRHFGMPEQDILMTPILEGLDGVKKMSKSYGNYIGITENADSMFGKIMSLPDGLMPRYFLLCTDLLEDEIGRIGHLPSARDQKARLAFEIVKLYHGEDAAQKAQEKFDALFSKKEIPKNAPEIKIDKDEISVLDLVMLSRPTESKSEARRLIEQGGVDLDGRVKNDPAEILQLKGGEILKIGKRSFIRIIFN